MRFFAAHVDRDGDKWASLAAEFKYVSIFSEDRQVSADAVGNSSR